VAAAAAAAAAAAVAAAGVRVWGERGGRKEPRSMPRLQIPPVETAGVQSSAKHCLCDLGSARAVHAYVIRCVYSILGRGINVHSVICGVSVTT
jgi:hypothetical protein